MLLKKSEKRGKDSTQLLDSEAGLENLQQQMDQQRRVFDTTLRSIVDFAYIFDREGRFVYSNKALLDLLQMSLGEVMGKTFHELPYPPELAEKLQEQIEAVVRTKAIVKDETPYVSPGGYVGYYEYIFTPVLNEYGAVEVVAGSTRDITERKLTQESLRQSRERLKAALEGSGGGMFIWDSRTDQLEWDSNLCRLFGVDEDEGVHTMDEFLQMLHGQDRKTVSSAFQRCRGDGSSVDIEFRLRLSDKSYRWIHYIGRPLHDSDGQTATMSGICLDVSERKRAESEAELLAAVAVDLGLYGSTREIMNLVGSKIGKHFGLSLCAFVEINDAEDEAKIDYEWTREDIQSVRGTYYLPDYLSPEFQAAGRRGDIFAVSDTAEDPRVDAVGYAALNIGAFACIPLIRSGKWRFLFAMYHSEPHDWTQNELDLSRELATRIWNRIERSRAEEELQKTLDELEERVRSRTKELEEANSALLSEMHQHQAAEKQKSELLERVVTTQEDERRRIARDIHDHLGQRVTALRLHLELFGTALNDSATLNPQFRAMRNIAERLDEEVGFLAWELRPALLDDLGLAAAANEFVQEWSNRRGIPASFHSTVAGRERLDPAVETHLYRIMQEALNNIGKHARASQVSLLFESNDQSLRLIIEDDGVGFDPAEPPKGKKRSKGLGLIGMRERAMLVGGDLQIESTPGNGTTIYVSIPGK
jgi:PAS domain S-box-containing protein